MEMGFPLRSILNAVSVTKSSGEVSAHTINVLASWMLEHPCTDYLGATSMEDDHSIEFIDFPQRTEDVWGEVASGTRPGGYEVRELQLTFFSSIHRKRLAFFYESWAFAFIVNIYIFSKVTIWIWKAYVADCLFQNGTRNPTLVYH